MPLTSRPLKSVSTAAEVDARILALTVHVPSSTLGSFKFVNLHDATLGFRSEGSRIPG